MQKIKCILFDVFGTVVDWRESIASEASLFGERYNINGNWYDFADKWRNAYNTEIQSVNQGKRNWISVDDIHMERLEGLLEEYKFPKLEKEEKISFNQSWHRLKPWPDSVEGLQRLKSKYIIAPLSNGNMSLLTNMGKYSNLPWDAILSAELSTKYKPDPSVYQLGAKLMGCETSETLMVAAHKFDLIGALNAGLRTAMVIRPKEFGERKADIDNDERWEYYSKDFNQLADQLNCK